MNDTAGQVRYDITADAQEFIDELEKARASLKDFTEEIEDADDEMAQAWQNLADEYADAWGDAAWKAVEPSVRYIGDSISNVASMTGSIGEAAVKTFATISAAGVAALTNIARSGLEGADSLAKYNSQIIGLANTTADANSAMEVAVKFFKQNPFQRFETVEAVKNLMTYDKSLADANTHSAQLVKTLDMLGVASLSTGTPIAELAFKWSEVTSQARISKGQFQELALRVPALYDAVAKKMGISAGEVADSLNRVGISSEVVKKAMEELYGLDTTKLNGSKKEVEEYVNSLTGAARQSAEAYVAFGNTMARQTDRVKGRLSDIAQAFVGYELTAEGGFKALEGGIYQSMINLKKAFADTLLGSSEVGKKMQSSLSKLGNAIAPYIDKITEALPAALDKLFTIIDKIADHTEVLIPIVGVALAMVGKLASFIPGLGGALSTLASPFKKILNLFGRAPFALKVFYVLFGSGVFKAIMKGELNDVLKSLLSSISKIATALAPVAKQLAEIAAKIGEKIAVPMLEALAKVLEVLANVISGLPTEVLTGFVVALMSLKTVGNLASPIIEGISTFRELKKTIIETFTERANLLRGIQKTASKTTGAGALQKSSTLSGLGQTLDEATGIGESVTEASESLTKGQQAMKTMRSGILNLILLAGAIAALGVAFNIANRMIPDDMGPLIGKLALMAGVVAAFGTLSWAIGKVDVKATSILKMAEIAGAVATLGLAMMIANNLIPNEIGLLSAKLGIMAGTVAVFGTLGFAIDKLKVSPVAFLEMVEVAVAIAALAVAMMATDKLVPDNLGLLAGKLGIMAGAVAVMGGLAFVAGLAPAQIALGLLEFVGVAVAISALAVALKVVDKNVPSDLKKLTIQLVAIGEVVVGMGLLAGVIGAIITQPHIALFVGAGLVTMIALVAGVIFIAQELYLLQKIKFNKKRIETNIDMVMEVVSYILEEAADAGIKKMIKAFMEAGIVAAVSSVVNSYVKIANNLNYLQNLPLDADKIKANVGLIASVVNFLAPAPGTGVMGKLGDMINAFMQAGITQAVSNIVETYITISTNLQKLLTIEFDAETAKVKVQTIADIVKYITDLGPDGVLAGIGELIESFLQSGISGNISNVVENYSKIANSLSDLNNKVTTSEEERKSIEEKLGYIKSIVETISRAGGSIWTALQTLISSGAYSGTVENVQKISGGYVEIATKLVELADKIPATEDDQVQIAVKLGYVLGIVKTIATQGESIWKSFQMMIASDNYKKAVGNVDEVLNTYPSVFEKIRKIYDVVNEAGENFDPEKAKQNVDNITQVVQKVLDIKNGGIFQGISEFFAGGTISVDKVKDIAEIIKHFGSIATRINQIEDVGGENYDKIEHIKTVLQKVKDCPRMEDNERAKLIGTVNLANDMLWVSGTLTHRMNSIEDIGGENYAKIDHVKTAIEKIRSIPGMEDDEKVRIINAVNGAADAADAMGRFVSKVNALQEPNNELLNSVIASIKNTVSRLADVTTEAAARFRVVGQVMIDNLIGGIESKFNELSAKATEVQSTIWNAIEFKMQDEYYQGVALASKILEGFITKMPDFKKAGADVQGTIWGAIEPKMSDEYNQGKALAQHIINGFNSKHQGDDTFYRAGANATQGFINGAYSKDVWSVGWNIANRYLNGLKTRGQQGSPWKTTYKSGIWAVEGMIDGIEKMSYKLKETARSTAQMVIDNLTVDNLADTIGFNNLKNLSMSISGQGQEGTLGGVNSNSNTINIYNTNYAQSDFSRMSRDIMFNISRL